jgi:hypothetical protein
MTSGLPNAGTFVAELMQSRDMNVSGARAIMRAQGTVFGRQPAALGNCRVVRTAWRIFFVALFVAFIVAIKMHWLPRMPIWISAPAIFLVCYGLCRIWSRYHGRACVTVYHESLKGDRNLRFDADGIVSSGCGIVSSIPWSAIHDIVVNKDWLVIYPSPINTMSVPKAACEGQDVEGFCAELVRHWQAQRAPTGVAA